MRGTTITVDAVYRASILDLLRGMFAFFRRIELIGYGWELRYDSFPIS